MARTAYPTSALIATRVLVVDCQTTSSRPADGQVVELAWSWLTPREAVEPQARLVRLGDGVPLPRAVRRITGLTPEHLEEGGIDEEAAWRALLEAAGEAPVPTVIHYATFERAFFADLATRHGPEELPFDVLCTHEIAKRLLPDLPRHTLRALAGYFGHGAELLRRGEGHVEATAFVWRHLVGELAARGVHTWADAQQFVASRRARRSSKKGVPLDRARRLSLPSAPGIYRYLRRDGSVLYVGKAIDLKRRVNSYFSGRRSQRAHTQEMLAQASDVEVEVTATALEASVLETDRIKELAPPYNVQLLDQDRSAWFASPSLREVSSQADDEHRLGPLPSRWTLDAFTTLVDLLDAPQTASPRTMGRAMAEGSGLGPSSEELAAGVALFHARYPTLRRAWSTAAALLHHGKHLAELDARRLLDPGEKGAGPGPRPWDPARVARHIERVVLQASRALRRARWLCLLSEASVVFHEPESSAARLLQLHAGAIVERAFVPPERPLPVPAPVPLRERQAQIDLTVYDRLRVLSTELKRLAQHSDDLRIRIGPRPPLTGAALRRLLLLC